VTALVLVADANSVGVQLTALAVMTVVLAFGIFIIWSSDRTRSSRRRVR
jgi:hypothetical protein